MKQLGYGFAVEIVEVDYAYLAAHSRNIAYDLRRFGLADRKLVLRGIEFLDHFHKGFHCKRIVLGGDSELFLYIALAYVFLGEDIELSDDLTGVLYKLSSVIRKGNASAAAVVEMLNQWEELVNLRET